MRFLVWMLAVYCAASLFGSGVAWAQDGFRICNRSGQDAEIATAVDLGDGGGPAGVYLSKGWYEFGNGQCFVMWPGPLQHRYFFIYAQNKQSGREWKGDVPVCVSREPFDLQSATCGPDKYSRPFVRIDTGNSASWTYTLQP
jgi:uncharacterized membrane protein